MPSHRNPANFVRNGKPVGTLSGYSSQLVVDEGIRWLTEVRDSKKPFFLYVCFHEPHEPIASDEKYTSLYPSDDPSYSAHHGNITQMDAAFGRLMKSLDDQGLRENTFVFFTSDNGPAITPQHPHGSAGPFRDKKGSLYEGGIRVPGIVRWPGRIAAGSESDVPVCGVDFLPTICAITGVEPPRDRKLDGASILPVFEKGQVARTTPLYWHFNRAAGELKVALRSGDWKVLATLDQPPLPRSNNITDEEEKLFKTTKLASFTLYNLRTDPAESRDLAASEPDKLNELKGVLQEKYLEVQSESPVWPAWTFTNSEGKRIELPEYAKKKRPATPPKKK